jgi:hypothetical protein
MTDCKESESPDEKPTGRNAFYGIVVFAAFLYAAWVGWKAFDIYRLGHYDLVLGGPDGNFQFVCFFHLFVTVISTFLYGGGLIVFRRRLARCSVRRVVVCSILATIPMLIWYTVGNSIDSKWAIFWPAVWLLLAGRILCPGKRVDFAEGRVGGKNSKD